jgi:hypothetical protein
MKAIEKINKILRILQIAAAALLVIMLAKAMKMLFVPMKGEGFF